MRTTPSAVTVVAVEVLVAAIAGCGSETGRMQGASRPTATTGTTSASADAGNRVMTPGARPDLCTQVDLERPTPPMPKPQSPGRTVVLSPDARLDPAPNVHPAVSAGTAWASVTRPRGGVPDAPVELLIGYLSTLYPLGNRGPQISHVLAWVLRLHHVAFGGFQGGDFVGATSVPRPVCVFTNGYIAINATTGAAYYCPDYQAWAFDDLAARATGTNLWSGDIMVESGDGGVSSDGDLGIATTPGTGFGIVTANVSQSAIVACESLGPALAAMYANTPLPDGTVGRLDFITRTSA
jgi:hypothetical protein